MGRRKEVGAQCKDSQVGASRGRGGGGGGNDVIMTSSRSKKRINVSFTGFFLDSKTSSKILNACELLLSAQYLESVRKFRRV